MKVNGLSGMFGKYNDEKATILGAEGSKVPGRFEVEFEDGSKLFLLMKDLTRWQEAAPPVVPASNAGIMVSIDGLGQCDQNAY